MHVEWQLFANSIFAAFSASVFPLFGALVIHRWIINQSTGIAPEQALSLEGEGWVRVADADGGDARLRRARSHPDPLPAGKRE